MDPARSKELMYACLEANQKVNFDSTNLTNQVLDLNDVIASGKSDASGRFSIEGDSSRFSGEGRHYKKIDKH